MNKTLEARLDALAQDPYYSDNVRNLLSETLFLISALRTTDRVLKKGADIKNQRILELADKCDALQAELTAARETIDLLSAHSNGAIEKERDTAQANEARLRKSIENAPHPGNCAGLWGCMRHEKTGEWTYPSIDLCDCWKRQALGGE